MRHETAVLAAAVLLVVCGVAMAADPPYYQRKGMWQETMQASREALAAWEAEQAKQTKPARAPARRRFRLGPFYRIGPFSQPGKDAFAFAFEPEKKIELDKSYGKLRWQATRDADSVVHQLTCPANAAIYFYRTITAPRAMRVMTYFGSDDGLAVWCNGRKIISRKVLRGVSANQDKARLELRKGDNELLIKIWNNSGQCGYYFSPTGQARQRRRDPGAIARQELWDLAFRDFSDSEARQQMQWEQADRIWLRDWPAGDLAALARHYVGATRGTRAGEEVRKLAAAARTQADLAKIRRLYYQTKRIEQALAGLKMLNFKALRLAIEDLTDTFGAKYPRGAEFLRRLDAMEKTVLGAAAAGSVDQGKLAGVAQQAVRLQREALLANPLLDFSKLLVVKRSLRSPRLGLPQNWQGNCALPRNGYDNEIAVLSPVAPTGRLTTLYRPEGSEFVGDVDLHFDADRMLFSSLDKNRRWQVYELTADGKELRQVTRGSGTDVDNYDACYLPDGRIIFGSTRVFQGVPCVGGGNSVANLFIMDAEGSPKSIRQLTFEQDHDWCPTVMHDGRVMYTRWEYSDTPHYFTRVLFSMNPDGTQQMELYGSNSYWPNSTFYARPCPGHPTRVVAVISGHHGVPRMGELILFDPAKGRHEASGVVQRIPGYGKEVEPIIRDQLVNASWPRFLHPYPLSDKYFLVSCQATNRDTWDLYLVDVFDNMLKLYAEPGYAILEPVPLRKTPTPPVIPDKVDLKRKDAILYVADIYTGPGLKGVPRGTVKGLRLFAFHYAYYRMGGHIHIGIDGPWDVHRILGTVPVQPDGSAMFRVPANTPIALQPVDKDGKALQVMRSWLTAMPGEMLSCVGCHEKQSDTAPISYGLAARKPDEIRPWRGPSRGFGFKREVQPVLDKYCVSCHDGTKAQSGKPMPDFRGGQKGWRGFTASYVALHPYVRRPGPESDYHLTPPLEYHADTSELIQMLRKGHGRVRLDAEAWDRLITWIDLNVPDHGTWSEHRGIAGDIHKRRLEMAKLYAGLTEDPEKILPARTGSPKAVLPGPPPKRPALLRIPGWPFDPAEARRRRQEAFRRLGGPDGKPPEMTIGLGDGVQLALALIPAGEFVMGDVTGWPDEWPQARVKIDRPFWMGKFEVTNAQYRRFDPAHDSRYISWYNKDQNRRGELANRDTQPAIRVSWQRAMAYCRFLQERTGLRFSLPTEAQWEYACRAGTATAMNYGPVDADFGRHANLADQRVNSLTRRDSPNWIPSVPNVNDGSIVTDNVGKYTANAWDLHDMHGNVAEWTRTTYRPYPYDRDDGRNAPTVGGRKVVRGGSFYDRPKRGRSAFRLDYPSWQGVYNVGFRVVAEADAKTIAALGKRGK